MPKRRRVTDPTAPWPYPGARWWSFDLHTHTPASSDVTSDVTPEEWLLACMRARLDCVGVTDHNSGAWIDRLKSALEALEEQQHEEFRPLYLFPGVELTVNGGFHLLALFDLDAKTADIEGLLGSVGYRGRQGHDGAATRKSPIETVQAVLDAGAIPIPAHVDRPKGLLQLRSESDAGALLDAVTVAQVLDSNAILAAEVVDPNTRKPQIYTERHLRWAEVLGSDAHEPDKLGARYTWVKMAQPALDALRLALLDGASYSIRRSDEPEPFDPFHVPTHCVEGIRISDARYMGRGESAEFRFSPWLSALVGGRGTGKSTVIHALRLASRRDGELAHLEEGSEARVTFDRFGRVPRSRMARGGLTPETELQWSVLRHGVRHRVNWRNDGQGTAVEDQKDDGSWVESASQSVPPDRFPIRIFSQGQIAGLAADDRQALMHVIDQAANTSALREDLEKARSAFYSTRAGVRELDARLSRRPDELVVEQEDVERKLERFEEAAHRTVLREYRRRGRQRAEVDRQFREVTEAAERIEHTADDLDPTDVPVDVFGEESKEDDAAETISALHEAMRDAAERLRSTARQLLAKAASQRAMLGESAWHDACGEATERYEELVEALRSVGVDGPEQYGALVQERRRILSEREQLKSQREERDRLRGRADAQLLEIGRLRRQLSRIRQEFLAGALAGDPFVRMEIRPYEPDPLVMERHLREILNVLDDRFREDILVREDGQPAKGIVAELVLDVSPSASDPAEVHEQKLQDLKLRFESACEGNGDFGGHFNNYCEREFGKAPEFLDRLLAWFPGDGLTVEYSPKGDGRDFRPIAQASAGQRSAAMLAFLLAHGDEPLILDQPEDDLDNKLIYDLVVRQIRENKLQRQIIVVTHNPNIVVNGDAEMLHVMDFSAGQCRVAREGSLQEREIRDEVCRVMEGGRDAFERRYRRLGDEPGVR
ncbi:TrlF family AAA-like ATPase [Candidatus Palauibacter sp.]|uniref:TrlF family AAA-like ATPase n=1 Tax=Candidatus Palauibacter sp. TaxID=3101350 RepID=UPI003C701F19